MARFVDPLRKLSDDQAPHTNNLIALNNNVTRMNLSGPRQCIFLAPTSGVMQNRVKGEYSR